MTHYVRCIIQLLLCSKAKCIQDEDIHVEDSDIAWLESVTVDETETRTSNRIQRQEQAQAEEEWWSTNWDRIEKCYLIASMDVPLSVPCQCSNRKQATVLVMSLECVYC